MILNYESQSNQLRTDMEQASQMTNRIGQIINKKLQNHKHLRNSHLESYKVNIRKKTQINLIIQQFLNQDIPTDFKQAHQWGIRLSQVLLHPHTYQIPAQNVLQVFRLTQKFPTFQMLSTFNLIIQKCTIQALHLVFQYDVMKLLHSFLSAETYNKQNLAYSQIAMNIIAQICSKNQRIRNFAVVNHQTHTYCFRAYNSFDKSLEKNYIRLLLSFTVTKMSQYNEHFFRIVKCIIGKLIQGKQKIEKQENNYIQNNVIEWSQKMRMIVESLKNLLKMKQNWIQQLIQSVNMISTFEICLGFINKCVVLHKLHNFRSCLPLLHECLMFCTYYLEISVSQHLPISQFYSIIISILPQSGNNFYKGVQQSAIRQDIYYILSNCICDYSLNSQAVLRVIFNKNPVNLDLIQGYNLLNVTKIKEDKQADNIISTLCYNCQEQNYTKCLYEIVYLISALIENVQFSIIAPLILNSQLVSILLEKLIIQNPSNYSISHLKYIQNLSSQTSWLQSAQIMTIRCLKVFLTKLFENRLCSNRFWLLINSEKLRTISYTYKSTELCSEIEVFLNMEKLRIDTIQELLQRP